MLAHIKIPPNTRRTDLPRKLYTQVLVESYSEAKQMAQSVTRTATEIDLDLLSTPSIHEIVEDNYNVWRRILEITIRTANL